MIKRECNLIILNIFILEGGPNEQNLSPQIILEK
jgi:hypothetical protein